AELAAQLDDARHQLTASRMPVELGHQYAIELHELGLEVGDPTQIRITGAKVVDHQVDGPARAYVAKNIHAELEMQKRHRLGNFQIDIVVVRKNRIVGAHQPAFAELVRMNVEERGRARAKRNRD